MTGMVVSKSKMLKLGFMPRNISVASIGIFVALRIFKHRSKLKTSVLKCLIACIYMNASGSRNNKFRAGQFSDVVLNCKSQTCT